MVDPQTRTGGEAPGADQWGSEGQPTSSGQGEATEYIIQEENKKKNFFPREKKKERTKKRRNKIKKK